MKYWIGFIDKDATAVASIYDGNGTSIFSGGFNHRAAGGRVFMKTYVETANQWGWDRIPDCFNNVNKCNNDQTWELPILVYDYRTNEVYLGFASNKNLVCMPYDWKTMTGFMDRLDFSSGVIMIQAIKNIMDSAKIEAIR